jgi:hypothetical protein
MNKIFALVVFPLIFILGGCGPIQVVNDGSQPPPLPQNCDMASAYATGVNDAKNNNDMQTNYAVNCLGNNAALNDNYRQGYRFTFSKLHPGSPIIIYQNSNHHYHPWIGPQPYNPGPRPVYPYNGGTANPYNHQWNRPGNPPPPVLPNQPNYPPPPPPPIVPDQHHDHTWPDRHSNNPLPPPVVPNQPNNPPPPVAPDPHRGHSWPDHHGNNPPVVPDQHDNPSPPVTVPPITVPPVTPTPATPEQGTDPHDNPGEREKHHHKLPSDPT